MITRVAIVLCLGLLFTTYIYAYSSNRHTASYVKRGVKGLALQATRFKKVPTEDTKKLLYEAISKTQPNGLVATKDQRQRIEALVATLEISNPTVNPALSEKMNGMKAYDKDMIKDMTEIYSIVFSIVAYASSIVYVNLL